MKNITIAVFCLLLLNACRKDNSKFDGPSIQDLYSNFKLIDNFKCDKDSVSFAAGEVSHFTASFNKAVKWQISITGTTSKAQKIITGQSKTIDANNGTWNGSTTVFPIFGVENCIAKLTVEGVTDSFLLPIKIRSTKVNNGLVIADFENGFNSAWTKFAQSGANMDFNVKADTYAPQGAKYLNMAGTVNWDWCIGYIDFPATAYSASNTLALATNPDAVFFNCLIYGVPNTNSSLVLFQFKEDENADGIFNAANEDEYDYQIDVNWSGWKLVTIKYSDVTSMVNGQPVTPKGNSQHNPNKIGKISMYHLANKDNGFASCKIDYLIFTSSPIEP